MRLFLCGFKLPSEQNQSCDTVSRPKIHLICPKVSGQQKRIWQHLHFGLDNLLGQQHMALPQTDDVGRIWRETHFVSLPHPTAFV